MGRTGQTQMEPPATHPLPQKAATAKSTAKKTKKDKKKRNTENFKMTFSQSDRYH
jgi:hypothetical protein